MLDIKLKGLRHQRLYRIRMTHYYLERSFTDHMFVMDYKLGEGWYDPRIIPYQPPKLRALSYGISLWTGNV